jgi:hypothetical protein
MISKLHNYASRNLLDLRGWPMLLASRIVYFLNLKSKIEAMRHFPEAGLLHIESNILVFTLALNERQDFELI